MPKKYGVSRMDSEEKLIAKLAAKLFAGYIASDRSLCERDQLIKLCILEARKICAEVCKPVVTMAIHKNE